MQVKFRPSSHSTDYALVGVCEDEKAAQNLKKNVAKYIKKRLNQSEDLDWELPEVDSVENRVIFAVHSNDSSAFSDVRCFIEEKGAKTSTRYTYQELNITLKLPEKAGINTLPLLMPPTEVSLARFLKKVAIKSKTKKGTIVFVYRGEAIFDTEQKNFEHEEQVIKSTPNWAVKVLYDSQQRWIKELKQLHLMNRQAQH
jgi:hypothetical protein